MRVPAQIASAARIRGRRTKGDLVSWKGSYVPLLDAEYNNDAEATAYAVRLLAKVNPNDPLLTGAAQWLMLARNGGVWWDSTEQTAMVLFGLVDYLAASHELESDFTVDVLVNGQPGGRAPLHRSRRAERRLACDRCRCRTAAAGRQ